VRPFHRLHGINKDGDNDNRQRDELKSINALLRLNRLHSATSKEADTIVDTTRDESMHEYGDGVVIKLRFNVAVNKCNHYHMFRSWRQNSTGRDE